jgi:hypothetical protein
MTKIITFTCFTLILILTGCERHEETDKNISNAATEAINTMPAAVPIAVTAEDTPTARPEFMLLQEPIELDLHESPSQALQQWYEIRDARPALLLFANNPLLQATTSSVQRNLLTHLAEGDEIALRPVTTNPAILPGMTLDAALQTGLFSAVYWVIPSSKTMTELSVDIFREQMIKIGALNDQEAGSLTLHEGVFSGTVRGLPFHALHPQANFTINGPVAFHFDLSYFSPLYKSEIKTPLFSLVYQTLKHLRDQQVKAIAASFSYSQLSGEVPLGSRFIGDVFAQLFLAPDMVDKPLPADWQERAKALYLPELFNMSTAREILLQLQSSHPGDPSLYYALYQISRQSQSTRHAALNHLADAVQRDPVYSTEYLYLAPLAREKGHPDEAIRVLQLAAVARPDNPFVTLELARALIADGQTDKAVPLLKQLLALNWSKHFYPDMPNFLENLLAEADNLQKP